MVERHNVAKINVLFGNDLRPLYTSWLPAAKPACYLSELSFAAGFDREGSAAAVSAISQFDLLQVSGSAEAAQLNGRAFAGSAGLCPVVQDLQLLRRSN